MQHSTGCSPRVFGKISTYEHMRNKTTADLTADRLAGVTQQSDTIINRAQVIYSASYS